MLIEQSIHEPRFDLDPAILDTISHTTAVNISQLRDTDDLYSAGLKSLAAIRLIAALEDRFGIEFPPTVMHRGAFATIERIRETVAATLPRVDRDE